MLALFAEGEALLRLIESGNIDQVIIEIPEWQAQVMTMTAKKTSGSIRSTVGRAGEDASRDCTAYCSSTWHDESSVTGGNECCPKTTLSR